MSEAEFTAFLGQALRNLAAFSADGSLHYVCMDWRHLDELLAAGRGAYGALQCLCIWVKNNESDTDPHSSGPTFTEADEQIIQRIRARLRSETE